MVIQGVAVLIAAVVLSGGCASGARPSWGWRNPETGIVRFVDMTGGGLGVFNKDEFGSRGMDYSQQIEATDEAGDLPTIWVTEDRVMRSGPLAIPMGKYPADIGFPSQEACERFRSQHPNYTKPEEVCRMMRYRPAPPGPEASR